jgi:hypothetical protein
MRTSYLAWISSLVVTGMMAGCPSEDSSDNNGVCTLESSIADLGQLTARKANYCNVPMSMGQRKWYRVSATVPGTDDVVQLELWAGVGAFAGGPVRTGMFTIAGDDAALATCGVCVRALGNKGTADEQEYFATGGTVEVTALGVDGETVSATIRNATFKEVDPTSRKVVSGGCDSSLANLQVSGTVVALGMNGGGGGGGGGGNNNCPTVIGD